MRKNAQVRHAVIVNHNAGSPYHGPNFRSYYAGLGWAQREINVTIVCSSFSHKLTRLPRVHGEYAAEVIDGLRYIWLRTGRFSTSIGRAANYLHFFRRLSLVPDIIREPVDYVICSSPPPFWIWFCDAFARSKGAALIFEVRDLWPDVIFETRRTGVLNPVAWIMKFAEKAAYHRADFVVSVNESAIKVMRRRGLSDARFRAIPNGAALPSKRPCSSGDLPRAAEKCRELKSSGQFVVGYAGALSSVYGLSFLVKAAEYLAHRRIVFVVAGRGPMHGELRLKADRLPNLYLAGWIPKEQLQLFLREVDVCYAGLLDIKSFTFGSDSTKLYEYMKASKPILHAVGDKNSIVIKARCGVRVEPESVSALVDGLCLLERSPESRLRRWGMNGRRFLEEQRSYRVLTDKWLHLFKGLDERTGRSVPAE